MPCASAQESRAHGDTILPWKLVKAASERQFCTTTNIFFLQVLLHYKIQLLRPLGFLFTVLCTLF